MTAAMRQILILKTGCTIDAIARERGDFEDWIAAGMALSGTGVLTVPVFKDMPLPAPDGFAGIVVTGSPAMVTQREPWITTSEQFLRDALAANVPVLGICFGHQLLAQALGGDVGWNPGGREIGTVDVRRDEAAADDPLFTGLAADFPAHVTHMQSVIRVPEEATVLAGNAFDPHQGVRFAPLAWGMQFHPEFDEGIMAGYIRERASQLKEEGLDPQILLERVRPAPEAHSLLRRFAAICRAAQTE